MIATKGTAVGKGKRNGKKAIDIADIPKPTTSAPIPERRNMRVTSRICIIKYIIFKSYLPSKNRVAKLTPMLNSIEVEQEIQILDTYEDYYSSGGILTQEDYELVLSITHMQEEDAKQELFNCLEQVNKEREKEKYEKARIDSLLEREWVACQSNCVAKRREENGDVEATRVEVSKKEAIAYYLLRCQENFGVDTKDEETKGTPTNCMSDRELLATIFFITQKSKYYSMREGFPTMFKIS